MFWAREGMFGDNRSRVGDGSAGRSLSPRVPVWSCATRFEVDLSGFCASGGLFQAFSVCKFVPVLLRCDECVMDFTGRLSALKGASHLIPHLDTSVCLRRAFAAHPRPLHEAWRGHHHRRLQSVKQTAKGSWIDGEFLHLRPPSTPTSHLRCHTVVEQRW